jgi:hypothetical protein
MYGTVQSIWRKTKRSLYGSAHVRGGVLWDSGVVSEEVSRVVSDASGTLCWTTSSDPRTLPSLKEDEFTVKALLAIDVRVEKAMDACVFRGKDREAEEESLSVESRWEGVFDGEDGVGGQGKGRGGGHGKETRFSPSVGW